MSSTVQSPIGDGAGAIMAWRPGMLLERWNWKAALLSASTRAPIFLLTTLAYGWHRATLAAAIEVAYWSLTAGIIAGMVQEFRNWRPVWLAALLILVGVPFVAQLFDYTIHLLAHTPNLRTGTIASLVFAEVAALFNWYSMQHGTLLVGPEQASFLHDLYRLPKLIVGFLLAPIRWIKGRLLSNHD